MRTVIKQTWLKIIKQFKKVFVCLDDPSSLQEAVLTPDRKNTTVDGRNES